MLVVVRTVPTAEVSCQGGEDHNRADHERGYGHHHRPTGRGGAGGVLVVAGLWAIGKGVRHYMWALREARARVSEEKAWPVTPARW